jgi:hypothetical protein
MTIEVGHHDKIFNLQEAKDHLGLVQSITKKHQALLAPVQARLNRMLSNDPRRAGVEKEYEQLVSKWVGKIQQLGASVQGLWIVEFNMGDVLLCWRYPELSLNYVRPADQPFSERQKLSNYIEINDPDWV